MFRRYGTAALSRAQARLFSSQLAPITVFIDGEKEEVTPGDVKGAWTQLASRGTVRETRLYCSEERASKCNWQALGDVKLISPDLKEGTINLTLALDLMSQAFESTKREQDQVFALVISDPDLLEVAESVCVRFKDDLPRLRLLVLAPNHASWLRHEAYSLCDEFIEYDPSNPDDVSCPEEAPGEPTDDSGVFLSLKVLNSLGYLGEDLVSGVDFFEKKNMDRLPAWYKDRAVGKTPLARIGMLSSVFSDASVLNMWQRSVDPEQLRFKLAKYSLLDSPACSDAELQVALIKILSQWKQTPPSTSLAENMRSVMYHLDELRVARSRREKDEVS